MEGARAPDAPATSCSTREDYASVPRDEGREAYGVGDGDDGRSEKRRSSLFMGPVAGMGRSNWPARLLRDPLRSSRHPHPLPELPRSMLVGGGGGRGEEAETETQRN